MSDVFLSSYQARGASPTGASDRLPTESWSLHYAKMTISYREQKPDGSLGGSIQMGYDWSKNVKI
jgi:type VI protein secretion system component Hcp